MSEPSSGPVPTRFLSCTGPQLQPFIAHLKNIMPPATAVTGTEALKGLRDRGGNRSKEKMVGGGEGDKREEWEEVQREQ